jgi:hypothetical protein
MTLYVLAGGLYISILHGSAESRVTDTVALFTFVIRVACVIVYYWVGNCNPIAAYCTIVAEVSTTLYLYALVCWDYCKDDSGSIEKSYLKAVSFTVKQIIILVVVVVVSVDQLCCCCG